MSTNRQVIETALRMLGVLDADQDVNAEDARLGLQELNDLMAQMLSEGIDLGYTPQDNVSDDFPLEAMVEAQIKPILAVAMQTYYPSARPMDSVPARAASAMERLRLNAVLSTIEEASMTNLPLGSAQCHEFDISTLE